MKLVCRFQTVVQLGALASWFIPSNLTEEHLGILFSIIGGLLLVGVGFLFIWKTEWFLKNIGRIDWAERKLGGTRNFYKLLGLLVIFIGLLTMTGLLRGFLLGTVGRLFLPPGSN